MLGLKLKHVNKGVTSITWILKIRYPHWTKRTTTKPYTYFMRFGLICFVLVTPDGKVHGANMGPIWDQQDPGGPHVVHINFTIWDVISLLVDVIKWKYFPRYWPFVMVIPLTISSDAELWCFLWSAPEQTVEQTIKTLVIWDAIVIIMTSLLCIIFMWYI